jgi:2,4-dienoyl-CoA reductase-like NADH-dependent reductase (Old Yellow Enzyme family)
MPGLFTPYTLKGVTLRNRTAMSPMTMYRSVDGNMDDYHVSYLGARASCPRITRTAGRAWPRRRFRTAATTATRCTS